MPIQVGARQLAHGRGALVVSRGRFADVGIIQLGLDSGEVSLASDIPAPLPLTRTMLVRHMTTCCRSRNAADPDPALEHDPAQLLAYHLATLRGHDVDRPRNLAKSVTVE